MISYITGTIQETSANQVCLLVHNIGFAVKTPHPENFHVGKESSFYTYLHWHADQGPSMFGFTSTLEKEVFLLIIDCPKIGPKIALSILSQMEAPPFLDAVQREDAKILSSLNGLGAKKAAQIITSLKDKATKLITSGAVSLSSSASADNWHTLSDALTSLGYSKIEITKTIQLLSKSYSGDNPSLDQLLRSALGHLSK